MRKVVVCLLMLMFVSIIDAMLPKETKENNSINACLKNLVELLDIKK
jgi:hypothetical protein